MLEVEGRRSFAFAFGAGQPVVLMHGWGGHAGQLGGFVAPLLESGFQPILIEALGHGESDASRLGYRQASFLDFARGMAALENQVGRFHGVIAHSGGGVATVLALQAGLDLDRLVLIAPMARPHRYAALFSQALGLGPDVEARWQARASQRVGFQWDDLDVTRAGERIALPPALVIHDRADREVPYSEGRAIAESWPSARLITTEGLGHRRLLRDPEVIRGAVAFTTQD